MSSGLPTRKVEANLETQEFWDATAQGKLLLATCDRCAEIIWYPRGYCPECQSMATSWIESTGLGLVYSFSITRKGQGAWAEASPYVIAYVQLDDGPRILTNIVGCEVDHVAIGMRVKVAFEDPIEGSAIYCFTPA